jgi:hypothetical protein
MSKNARIKNLLIDISVMPCLFFGILLSECLLYLFVLRPFGMPTHQDDSAHSIKFMLEMILGIPVVLIIGCFGIVIGILLWSIIVNLFSSGHRVERLLQERHTVNVHYTALLRWGLSRTKFKAKPN